MEKLPTFAKYQDFVDFHKNGGYREIDAEYEKQGQADTFDLDTLLKGRYKVSK